ncbi:MAG: FeoB-associated Cys-rich membrane protein [Acetivibrio sp.]
MGMNFADFLVLSGILCIAGGIVFRFIKRAREGKIGCSCGCAGCPHKDCNKR